jgi:hypothetical protein
MTAEEIQRSLSPNVIAKADQASSALVDFVTHRSAQEIETMLEIFNNPGGLETFVRVGGRPLEVLILDFVACGLVHAMEMALDRMACEELGTAGPG